MSRLGRGAAWVTCWPLGAYLSLRHSQRKSEKRRAGALKSSSGPSNPMAVRDIAEIFKAHDVPNREALRMTARAMQDVHAGVMPYEAARRQLEEWEEK